MRLVVCLWLAAACGRLGFDTSDRVGDAGGGASDSIVIGGDDASTNATSCVSLPATCGDGTASCCDSAVAPGGMFYQNYDAVIRTLMDWPATVSPFRLDRYEVTVGRFRQFVEAGMGIQSTAPAAGAGARALNGTAMQAGWNPAWSSMLVASTAQLRAALACDAPFDTWTDSPQGNENRPINCLTWYEAFAFCVWDGGFLPTELELSFAASGGSQQRFYPWSSPGTSIAHDVTRASYSPDGVECVGDGMPSCTVADLVPVGSKSAGVGAFGHLDLSGNVFEWELDFLGGILVPCDDCANLIDTTGFDSHGTRGGSFRAELGVIVSVARNYGAVGDNRGGDYGVRCARPL